MFVRVLFCLVFLLISLPILVNSTENVQINIGAILENENLQKNFERAVKDVNEINSTVKFNYFLEKSIKDGEPLEVFDAVCSFLNKGVSGIIGPVNFVNQKAASSICHSFGIPHVFINDVSSKKKTTNDLNINIYPSVDALSRAYLDILLALGWKSFTIIYTDDDSFSKLSNFIDKAKSAGFVVYIKHLADTFEHEGYRPILEELRNSDQNFYFVESKDAVKVLEELQVSGMLGPEKKYFFTDLGFHLLDLQEFMYSGASLTGIRFPISETVASNNNEGTHLNITDLETALVYDAIKIFTNAVVFRNLSPNEINSKLDCKNTDYWTNGLSLYNSIIKNSFDGYSGLIQFDSYGSRNSLNLTVYQLEKRLVDIGTWNFHDGFNFYEKEDILEKTSKESKSLVGKHLVVTTKLTPPYTMLVESNIPLKGNDRFRGYAVDLIHELSILKGFNYTIMVTEDHKHGFYNEETGRWSGMMGDVMSGKADLAISDLTITSGRMEDFEFTLPFMHLGISILFQKPSVEAPSFFNFANPFSRELWIAMGYAFIATWFALFVIGRFSPSEWYTSYNHIEKKYLKSDLTLPNTFLFLVGGLFRQNSKVKIRSLPGRVICAVWWLFCFVLAAMYISCLISQRASPEEVPMFRNVEELVRKSESNGIKFGALKGGSTEDFFRNSKNPLYQEIYSYMLNHPEDMVYTNTDGVEKANSERYALFMESTSLTYTLGHNCNLEMYGGLLDQKGYGIGVRKGFKHLNELNHALLKISSQGKLDELRDKWWTKYSQCSEENYDTNEEIVAVNVEDILGLIWIVIFGVASALLCSLTEFSLCVYKLSKVLKLSYCMTFKHELKRCFTRKVKRRLKPEEIKRRVKEETPETIELS